ncbi:T9SS type A sorting domain-containing protein [Flavobacterium sp.]|uniref:T9SS type A sorting domain-containing protein n=1 Tax=Flavobacterium sp. TaxID=239 RepID=UPI00286B984D|nr:T9SS type A sorting domain-containing protein [Flavobacterium sp.]
MKNLFFCFSFLICFCVNAQQAAPNALSNNWKNCVIKQSDNNFFVGGRFDTPYPPIANPKIAVVNNNISNNFSITNSFFNNQNFDEVIAVENYTKYAPEQYRYVGGAFVYHNGVVVNGFMRITTNGSIDPTFTLNNGSPFYSAKIRAIAVQSDGRIILGGAFTNYLGATRSRIVRLNENGTLDTSFNNTGTGLNGEVYAIKIQADGKIIVGGDFTSYNGVAKERVARLNSNGSLDTSFNLDYIPSDKVRAVLIQSDGKIVIGGDFTISTPSDPSNPGQSQRLKTKAIARLLSNGNLDFSFNRVDGFYEPFTYQGVTSNVATVNTLSQYASGKIFVGGSFDSYIGVSRSNICLLNTDGSLDSSFGPSGPDGDVNASIVESSGNVVIVGGFWYYGAVIKNGVARVAPSGLALRMSNTSEETKSDEDFNREVVLGNQSSAITIFPNPASDYITINAENSPLDKITLMTIDGRTILSQVLQDTNSFKLNLENLPKGIFLVTVLTKEGKTETQKVVKK